MSADEFAGIGLAIGVVTGARSFKIDKIGRLTGIHYPQVWRPGENEAECRKSESDSWGGLMVNYRTLMQTYTPTYHFLWDTTPSTITNRPATPPTVGRRKGKKNVTTVPVPKLTYTPTSTTPSAPPPIEITAAQIADIPPKHTMTDCACGFYGYYDGSDDYHQDGYVSAVVEGYGETLIGTRGFRAMKSRIVALHIPEDVPAHLAKLVARNYADVPQFGSFDAMVQAYPTDGGDAAITPESDPTFWDRTL